MRAEQIRERLLKLDEERDNGVRKSRLGNSGPLYVIQVLPGKALRDKLTQSHADACGALFLF